METTQRKTKNGGSQFNLYARKSLYRHDHANLKQLLEQSDLISDKKAYFLETIEKKLHLPPRRPDGYRPFSTDNLYDQTGAIVCMSEWHHAAVFAKCGYVPGYRGLTRCNQWHLCPRCSATKWGEAIGKYAARFPNSQWASITCSWWEILDGVWVDQHDVRLLWEAGFYAINQLRKQGKIKGALSRAEIAAYFLPYAVRPHIHSLVELSEDHDIYEMEIGALMQKFLKKQNCPFSMTPSVVFKIVKNGQCPNVLWYFFLPHDLAEDYQWGRIKAEELGREDSLNFEVNTLLEDLSIFRDHYRCMRPIGSMWGKQER